MRSSTHAIQTRRLRQDSVEAAARFTPFVVLSTRRTGSTWVADMLGSHPEIRCYGELFLSRGSQGRPPLGTDVPYFFDTIAHRRATFIRPRPVWRYADAIFRGDGTTYAVGCKLAYGSAKHVPWFMAYLALNRISVVHLVRRNTLGHLLSIEAARSRGRYHAFVGEQIENPPVALDTRTLIANLEREERNVRLARVLLSRLRVPVHEAAYEDLVSEPAGFRSILNFLGVDPGRYSLQSRLQKWNRASFAEAIANYDEVEAVLSGTKYAALLETQAGTAAP